MKKEIVYMCFRYSTDLRKKLYKVTLIYTLIFVVIFLFVLYMYLQSIGEHSDLEDCCVMLFEAFLIFSLGCILPLRYMDVRSQKYHIDSDSLSIYRRGKKRSTLCLAKVECVMICRQELALTEGSRGGGSFISNESLSIVLFESDNINYILKHIYEAYPAVGHRSYEAYTNRAFEIQLGWPLLYTCFLDKTSWRNFLSNYSKTVIIPKSLYDANVCSIGEVLGTRSKLYIDELF